MVAIERERAARIARDVFGLEGEVTRLAGERDLNFRIDGHLLKLHHPDSDPVELELQDAVLAHLAAQPDAPPVPRVARPAAVVDGRTARLLTWLEGRPWSEVEPTPARLRELGRLVARVDRALRDFTHDAMRRPHPWNLAAAPAAAEHLELVDRELRPVVAAALERAPRLDDLPHQVIHNDANELNVLVDDGGAVAGLIDFGDVVWSARVCGLAVAGAYAMQGHDDPVRAVLPLIRGYDEVVPLRPDELAVLFGLMRARLAMSVCMAAFQHARDPANDYLLVSQRGVPDLLLRLAEASSDLAHFRFRDAVGYEANPGSRAIRQYFESGRARPVPVLDVDPSTAPAETLDLSGERMDHEGPGLALGRYGEHRGIYLQPQFRGRTIHLGCDLFLPAGSTVRCALAGTVAVAANNTLPGDYGGVAIVEHRADDDVAFWTLYGHLDPESLPPEGARLAAGEPVGLLGAEEVNGGWAPHLHLQLLTHLVGMGADVPGVAPTGEADLWKSISPDPNLLLRRPGGDAARTPRDRDGIAARRRANFSRALSLAYDEPLHIVRGRGAHLFDDRGRRWLDLVNNVAHVGHSHPRVVEAARRQMELLNTNTRYLHAAIVDYCRRLLELLPDPLRVCFLVNSGSEANDLALRLAHAHTGARDVLVLDHAYHGHLSSTMALSPYKFGADRPPHTHVCVRPDPYRGVHDPGAASVAGRLAALDGPPAAFFAESLQSCGGQIVYPDGYLAAAFAHVRAAGGVCVADEVQVGLGRVGSAVWGFELQGAVPDIVTMGKPLGNGHPLAAVVTTPEIARSFEAGPEYFNTFGGNPVSAEAGLAVLDVMRDEGLQANAARRGAQLIEGLRAVGHPLIGDVRGEGLFIGVELDSAAKARAVKEEVKRRGALISTDGPDDNVLKIKPPLVISADDCDFALDVIDSALGAVAAPDAV